MSIKEFFNYSLFEIDGHPVKVIMIALPVLMVLLSRIIDWFLWHYGLKLYFNRSSHNASKRKKVHNCLVMGLFFLSLFISLEILFNSPASNEKSDLWHRSLRILQIIFASGAIIYGFRLIIWIINDVLLVKYFEVKKVDKGRRYTITRLVIYLGVTFGILVLLRVMGLSVTFLLGGGAALLVGVGIGLQQTFNDLFSGIVILVEGTVSVGDIVMVDGMVARMKKIGLRVSEIETRDNSVLIIPNSKLVVENVHNWGHDYNPVRFQLEVGVAYGSDVRLVEKLLLEAAANHSHVLKKPKPKVQFKNFGDSSLDFVLHFYSNDHFNIEYVRSDIRFIIVSLFASNDIQIPFPQRDLWIKNAKELKYKPSSMDRPRSEFDKETED